MQSSLSSSPAQITVLCIACSSENCDRWQEWLKADRRYRLIVWQSDVNVNLGPAWSPAVILLGSGAGIDRLTALTTQWPTAGVMVILEPEQEVEVADWLAQGADDYLISQQFSQIRLCYAVHRLATQAQVLEQRIAACTAELRQAKHVAEMTNHINHRLMADLSHDLRNPLSKILGLSQLLSDDASLPPQHQDTLNMIYASGEYLLSIINAALNTIQPRPEVLSRRSSRRVVGLAPGSMPCRILIVDDDWTSRVLLQTLLLPLGFELQIAVNGQEAITVWADWQPHLICLAMAMDGLDGYTTTRHLRTIEQKQLKPETPPQWFIPTPIIALIDRHQDDANQAQVAGCNRWLPKPIQPDQMLEAIARCLDVKYIYAPEPAAVELN